MGLGIERFLEFAMMFTRTLKPTHKRSILPLPFLQVGTRKDCVKQGAWHKPRQGMWPAWA